jgi:hypothetical protein
VPQQYLPDGAEDAVYYRPSRHGYEQEIAERMDRLADAPAHEPGTRRDRASVARPPAGPHGARGDDTPGDAGDTRDEAGL